VLGVVRACRARLSEPAAREFLRFAAVGGCGYLVNLAVYVTLTAAGLHYAVAAGLSFVVAATSNYAWNRVWTFQARKSAVVPQGLRAFGVSGLSLAANETLLIGFASVGAGHVAAQAAAIVLVTPFSFLAAKLWAFADDGRSIAARPTGS